MQFDTFADFCRYQGVEWFRRRTRYPLGSIERTLCVERARDNLATHRRANRAPTTPPEDRETRPPVNRSKAEWRKGLLILTHPETSPALVEDLTGLMNPPGKFSPTANFLRFQSMITEFMAAQPKNRNWPRYNAAVRIVLDWRADISPEDRFWKQDPEGFWQ